MTTQLLFGTMKLTCIQAGADDSLTEIGDEAYMKIIANDNLRCNAPLNPLGNGDFLNFIKSNGKNALQKGMQSGETARV